MALELGQSVRGRRQWARCLCGKVAHHLAVDKVAGSGFAVAGGYRENVGEAEDHTRSAGKLVRSALVDSG